MWSGNQYGSDPQWLRFLSRRLSWLAIPNLAAVVITIQVLGFFLVHFNPAWIGHLALLPGRVWNGEVWRLISYWAIPLSTSFLWMVFALWFLYFILNSVEAEWGAFKTTFYILISVVLTDLFSLIFGYGVAGIADFVSTLFLAAAALFPNAEIQIYFVLPVKMKYLGWIALAFFFLRLLQGSWMDRLFLLTIYSNYLIFFGPSLVNQYRQWKRRRDFKAKWR